MMEGHILFFFLVVMVQFVTGVLANGLIVVVHAIDLIMWKKMAPLDLLLFCLATSRIILQLCILFAQLCLFSLVRHTLFEDNITFVFIINELSLWFATWLGVFYCAKIATIPHPLFLWLKMRISRLVPWLILGSVLYVIITTFIHSRETSAILKPIFISLFPKNATQVGTGHATLLSVLVLGLTLPLFIFTVAVLLLIYSLWNYSRQMRTMVGTREYSGHAHISAMLSILSFLILYLSHYMVAVLISTQVLYLGSRTFVFCLLVIGMYPSIHSIVLILGNPKLKRNAKMFIVHCKCCHCTRAWVTSRSPRLSDLPVPPTHPSANKTSCSEACIMPS
ncbi:taste receptor, type 2, member 1 [Rattus norvegicus]|uniref:Taste receptor type 2 member 119 n=2 Tax=Rattus norvegicus TaxID=10116 RepID=TR119_RAT|nr:taste receptor type 2 member 119 [Rattus norvegicus]Q9JKU1.1 RecName: Full=Taste receptor type 2 member 119; Short=T2R119; AltName: Full=Taste receptor type 2 member 1; Short=T2R1; AltName: Full=Taste receptor type 2 member 19; Short=T2R19 [Rattus norvegicus]AAF43913.1 candidate taste receptor T2R1 [Rattus norvegicus]EDL82655.1 taste receptor, type 2, member 1 [Rattus norvegicus]|eukprot:NP_076483.1 taste receptor type 2 member 119 [Rattus norvegicus]